MTDIYEILKTKTADLIRANHLESDEIEVKARPLTSDEAIGNPEDKDYPIIKGRERLMQAEFRGSIGQAFSDMYGDYSGRLIDIVNMDLKNNFRRAVFIASLNALMRSLSLTDKTIHCRDNEPRECGIKLVEYVVKHYGKPKIAMVGFQPRMIEALSQNFEIRVTDMDDENIDSTKFNAIIQDPIKTKEHLDWCDIAMVTGSTIVNGTIHDFLIEKPVVFYGITISGAAKMLELTTYCHYGR